jgi:steroid delta-isomerase-like uncharacterized protein
MSTHANKALVRRYYDEVLNRRNLAVLDDLLAPTFVSYLPNGGALQRDHYQQAIRLSHATFPDLHVTIEDQIAEDDKVVTRYRAQGTHAADFAGIPATNKPVIVTAIHIHRVANGKLVEHWEAINLFGLLQQLGVIAG